jgi:outer membrane protein assembly factor BamB
MIASFSPNPSSLWPSVIVKQFVSIIFSLMLICFSVNSFAQARIENTQGSPSELIIDVEILNGTFLGNEQRNFYGLNAPDSLNVLWKKYLGSGKTVISRKAGTKYWKGAGWTGQPLLIREGIDTFLIQGTYSHYLKKININDTSLQWKADFNDVIKGTGTIWDNKNSKDSLTRLIILQGSRLGIDKYLDSKYVTSYRAISYFKGTELWKMNVKQTASYSRDVDGSALILNDTAYVGLENSIFTVFNPNPDSASIQDGMLQPQILDDTLLYTKNDVIRHRNNVVTESSSCKLLDHIYISSGSGHVFGFNLITRKLDWDFYTGSDMDGSAVVTSDSCIIVTVEKQYIKGQGGAFKLDPRKAPKESVVWYCPTKNANFAGWEGGIIGSAGVTDYQSISDTLDLAAFVGIDGYLYVVNHKQVNHNLKVLGPDSLTRYNPPQLIFKEHVGPSISTPLFVNNKLIVAGYDGIYLFEYDLVSFKFTLLDHFKTSFEATPVVYNHKIYVASRDGYLYCFGN